MADQGMLARLLAGLIGPGTTKPQPNFAPPTPAYAQPFTGLRNEPAPQLPAFEQPGQMLGQMQPPIPTASRQGNYGPAAMPPPVAQSAPPQGAQPWLALDDQSRTAAFDPVKDFSDPRNQHLVDEYGRLLAQNKLLGPV
jgi:hypothetical protein